MGSSYYERRARIADPNIGIDCSPAPAPGWQVVRVINAQDNVFDRRGYGVISSEYERLRFAITPMTGNSEVDPTAEPGGTANPSIEIRIWSAPARAFLPMHTPIVRAGMGAGAPYIVDVGNAWGSVIGCFVTNAITGYVHIAAQGYKLARD